MSASKINLTRPTIARKIYGYDVTEEQAVEYNKYRHNFHVFLGACVRDKQLTREERDEIKAVIKYANLEQLKSINRHDLRHRIITANDLRVSMPTDYPYRIAAKSRVRQASNYSPPCIFTYVNPEISLPIATS